MEIFKTINGKTGTVSFVPFSIEDPAGCTDEKNWTFAIIYDYEAALEDLDKVEKLCTQFPEKNEDTLISAIF